MKYCRQNRRRGAALQPNNVSRAGRYRPPETAALPQAAVPASPPANSPAAGGRGTDDGDVTTASRPRTEVAAGCPPAAHD